MNVTEHTSGDINTHGGNKRPPRTGLAPDVLPEVQKPFLAENLQTGVSTKNTLSGTAFEAVKKRSKDVPHWYALRVTYGREKKAYDYLVEKDVEAFYPTITSVKIVNGKRKAVEESHIPNIFFVYGTEKEMKSFVYDNVNLPYLRFYYRRFFSGTEIRKEPLIVPDNQIESLRIICEAKTDDIIVSADEIPKFKKGQLVRIINGGFKGVTGIFARYQGQQRVGIVIDGLLTAATAYIPSAFIQRLE